MKNILVLFTGGTIGSVVKGDTISVAGDGRFELIYAYKRAFGEDVRFECRQILNILSENMMFKGWERIIEVLNNVDTSNYSGIIITHGSDTLAYTSALLGMYFRHMDLPMCIVAANKPIAEPGSNAIFNFASAVRFIRESGLVGVYTVYERILPCNRVVPADTFNDRFSCYGERDGDPFWGIHKNWLLEPKKRLFTEPLRIEKPVLYLTAHPGMDFDRYDIKGLAAVLFEPYHSGTGPTELSNGERYSLCKFIERCHLEDVKVYICGVKDDTRMYDTLRSIIGAGAVPMKRISAQAAYMKLLLAYNQKEHPVSRIMSTSLYFEIVGEN